LAVGLKHCDGVPAAALMCGADVALEERSPKRSEAVASSKAKTLTHIDDLFNIGVSWL
jgi:hypothetical protein